ncbi:hypothetical protein [Streptomyces sp. NPDC059783]|uniref:hypothetical protein n=1 Tax=Streptomyces sp. NPDC059783 TaxID=3346944 RepID=UPI00364F2455
MKGLARGLVVTATLAAAFLASAGVGSADTIGWPVAPGTTDTSGTNDTTNGTIGWPVAPATTDPTDTTNGTIGWPVIGA